MSSMVVFMNNALGGTRAVAWCALLLAGVLACAVASNAPSPNSVSDEMSLFDVRVDYEGDSTVVTLVGPRDPIYTAFQQGEPRRLVIDLASVSFDGPREPLVVQDGFVKQISVSPFETAAGEPMTRVEIALLDEALWDVTVNEEGLVVRMEPVPGSGDPWDQASGGPPASWESGGELVSEPGEATAAPATKLLSIEVQDSGDALQVRLVTDGSVRAVESFVLENPDRLVIDLPGLVSEASAGRIEVGSELVKQIRVGQHPDKVRVVIDGGGASAPFEGRRILPGENTLEVVLGEASWADLAAAEPGDAVEPTLVADRDEEPDDGDSDLSSDEKREIAAEVAKMPEPARSTAVVIYGVQFDSQRSRDRIAVLSDSPADYRVLEPDPETAIVSFFDATIDPEAMVRITPDPGGPVSLVTAFQQPDMETPEVRVVIRRAAGLEPQVIRRGSLLFIDFERTGAVASLPPTLNQVAPAPIAELAGEMGMVVDETGKEAAMGGAPAPAPPQTPALPAAPAIPVAQPAIGVPSLMPVAPASFEPPAAVDILQEGGLIDGKVYSGRRISLDFKDVAVADVLRLIADVSDLNVIAGDEVQGNVTIRLVDVPWDQALDVILLTKGLGFVRVGNVLRIAPADLLQQEDELRLQERRAKEKLEDLVVKLQPVNYADVVEVSKMVQRLLSARGTVNVDKRTNTLIIKDIPSVVDEATALLNALDTQTPQVLIEAKIVEASLNFSRELGSVWSIDILKEQNSKAQDFNILPGPVIPDNNNFIVANPITQLATASFEVATLLFNKNFELDLQLQAAEIEGEGKVISSPRIMTLDNRTAKIEQGVSIPFQTFEGGDAQLEFIDAVLKLEVTPHVTPDRSIIMEIEVTRDAPDDSVATPTGSPAIAKNRAKTETLVKDGQTMVIGGIYVVTRSERESRVPWFHRIPILGAAFKNHEFSDLRKELLIFVTPRIIDPLS